MISIPLSQIASREAFAAAASEHRDAVEKHMLGKPGIMAPMAAPLVESVILRVPDTGPVALRGPDKILLAEYEIFDDTPAPPPPPTLDQRKMLLLVQLNEGAQAAKNALLSPARARLMMVEAYDAIAIPEDARSPAQVALIDAYSGFQSHCADIDRVVLRASVEIEDLTDLTISGWNPPTF